MTETSCFSASLNLNTRVSASVQTTQEKEINIRDVMGCVFTHCHVFNKNRKTLQLPESDVTLTLSEDDVTEGSLECYATTLHNVSEVYQSFKEIMDDVEDIASPVVEYYFPSLLRTKQFACVNIERTFTGTHVHVWSVIRNSKNELVRTEILHKNDVNEDITQLDAFYEEVRPGFLKVYVKTFSCVMCTECTPVPKYFQLDVCAFTDDFEDLLIVTMYFVHPLFQLTDYREVSLVSTLLFRTSVLRTGSAFVITFLSVVVVRQHLQNHLLLNYCIDFQQTCQE